MDETRKPEDRAGGGDGSRTHRFTRLRSDFASPRLTVGTLACAARDSLRKAEETFMAFFPPAVTEHLVRAQAEAVRAGQRLGDLAIENLERKASRAHELHEQVRNQRPRSIPVRRAQD